MARASRHPGPRRKSRSIEDRKHRRTTIGAGPSHRRGSHGGSVQGDGNPCARLAGARGLRMSVTYRDAAAADAAGLAELFRTVFLDTFGHLYAPADLASFFAAHDEELWAAQLCDPAF